VRFRIAISAGLAAVIVLSVFTMIKFDSRVSADGTEIDDLITGLDNSQQDEPNDFVMTEDERTGSATTAQVVEPQLEPIYVYPDGSIAPAPTDSLLGSSGEVDFDSDDWDDDHDDWDDDHDEEWEHECDDDDSGFFVEKLAGGLFSDRDDDDDDDHDDDHHDREHDDD
jgi:hypothetical protein